MRSFLASLCVWLLLASPVLAHSGPRSALDGTGSAVNPFRIAGGAITEASLPLLRTATRVASTERVGGYTTYFFSSGTGGLIPTTGSSGNPGTWEEPLDETSIDNYCGAPAVRCVLDGEPFSLGAIVNLNVTTTDCRDGEPCTVIESVSPWHIATVTGTLQNIFLNLDTTGGGGWAVLQGLRCVNTNGDCFSNTAGPANPPTPPNGKARTVLVNTSAVVTGNASDNCYTNHGAGYMVIFNGSCEIASGSTGDNPGFAPVHMSNTLAVGFTSVSNVTAASTDGNFIGSSDASATAAMTMNVMVISGYFDRASTGADGDAAVEINSDAADTINATFIRTAFRNGTNTAECVRATVSGSGETVNAKFIQSTATGCNNGIELALLASDSNFNLTTTAFSCDAVADNCVDLNDVDWITRASWTNSYMLYDSDDSADVFHVETGANPNQASEDSDDLTGLQADLDAKSPTFTMAADAATGVNSDDSFVQWQNSTQVWPQMQCVAGNDCWKAFDNAYTESLPFTLPAFIAGTQVSLVTLNGTDGNIGR